MLRVPPVSTDDLATFRRNHFSSSQQSTFCERFSSQGTHASHATAADDAWSYEKSQCADEQEDLGFYADGVRRTLTDEQIAILRLSEIRSLLRAKRQAAAKQAKRKKRKLRKKQIAQQKAAGIPTPVDLAAPETQVDIPESLEERRRNRLEATLWASKQGWEGQAPAQHPTSTGPPGNDQVSTEAGTNAPSKKFMWPVLEEEGGER